jgi:hypothetical protein
MRPKAVGTLSAKKRVSARANPETAALRQQLEWALEVGLRDTFPASDPVAIIQPVAAQPTIRSRRKGHRYSTT